ncbi:hypothetical protein FACS1894105_14330 [Clostridia bacterium]|nr:hypothetical protein FACS1894105_14330 [Clostridia bacterium]
MKIAIKVIILALAASVLFSCAQEQIAVSDTTASVEATTAESSRELSEREKNIASYNYPNINYDGYVFKIALRGEEGGNGYYDSYDIVCEEASADPVLDGVYKRNREIEDRFGITIKGIFVGDTSAAVRKSVSSGDHAYDIGFQQLRSSHTLALNGVLVDMMTVDSLDLSNPWWDQTILHDTSVMNKSMYATGDITVVDNYGTWIMMYNKKLQKDFNVPDLYALVRSGEWTFEKLSELMKLSIEDLNGDGKISKEDRVGMATSTDSIRNFFFSSGSRIIGKDANDLPFNALDTVQTINNIELIDKVFNPPAKCVVLTDETGSWENTQAMFTEDRALFYAEVMLHVQSIREMESDFGILPLPKASVEQERYYTSAHEMASAAVFIPVGHDGDLFLCT